MSRIHYKPIRVFVVHPQSLVRAALVAVIAATSDIEAVGEAPDLVRAETDLAWKCTDVALVSLAIFGAPPYAALSASQERNLDVRYITLCQDESIEQQAAAIGAGARGLVGLGTPGRSVCEALRSVGRGLRWMEASLERYLSRREPEDSRDLDFDALTPREKQVAALIARGESYQRIAAELNISGHTVKNHVRHIFDKLDVNSRVELAVLTVGVVD